MNLKQTMTNTYEVTYHYYSRAKPNTIIVQADELGSTVEKMMNDGTIQYVIVYRDRKEKRSRYKTGKLDRL
jgi:hypothetical protein